MSQPIDQLLHRRLAQRAQLDDPTAEEAARQNAPAQFASIALETNLGPLSQLLARVHQCVPQLILRIARRLFRDTRGRDLVLQSRQQ